MRTVLVPLVTVPPVGSALSLWSLHVDGPAVGYVASELGEMWSLVPPFKRPWVWLVVFWLDGTKEPPVEDYAPWTYVAELRMGYFDWMDGRDHSRYRRYEARLLTTDDGQAVRGRFGVTTDDF